MAVRLLSCDHCDFALSSSQITQKAFFHLCLPVFADRERLSVFEGQFTIPEGLDKRQIDQQRPVAERESVFWEQPLQFRNFRTGPTFAAGQNQAGPSIPWFYVDQVGYQNPVLAVRGWQQDFFLCQICLTAVQQGLP